MKPIALGLLLFASLASAASAAETRCGWIVNPTPANWWLTDAEGEWIMSTQGGEQAEGMDELPDFTEGEWVVTNGGSYGHGCGCMKVDTEEGDWKAITRIYSVKQLPLKKCEADPKLPHMGE